MSDTRSQVRECIYHNPGMHFSAIRQELGVATGQAQYHLRRLRRDDEVQKEAIEGRTHYFPPTYTDWERGAIALLRRETTREIVLLLLRENERPPAEIADRLDLARGTVEWHLSRLVEFDMAEKVDRSDGRRVAVRLTDREAVYRLLREIEPRLLDRFVDRFTRLTDELFD